MNKLIINDKTLAIVKQDFLAGTPIAIPTDTNYNLICNPYDQRAIERVFKFKERPCDKP